MLGAKYGVKLANVLNTGTAYKNYRKN